MDYILEGILVTCNSKKQVIRNGRIGVRGDKILFVHSDKKRQKIPSDFQNSLSIVVKGYIYPGLIDLHNHLAYNYLPLWKDIKKKFADRYQWARLKSYLEEISAPTKLLAHSNPVELIKYTESKALIGGVTSIDGYAKFNKSYAAWLLRNIEVEPFSNLEPKIYQSVLRLKSEQEFLDVQEKMQNGNAFIYHLAEGTSEKLFEEYNELEQHNLILSKLVGIHCTALNSNQWKVMGNNNVKLVWSPLSNLLLYGATTVVQDAKKNNVLISLGSDWSPTGSKSVLWELKVADLVNKEMNNIFSDIELVEMVTINPAKSVSIDDRIGSIAPGLFADLVVFDNNYDDPYRNLILSTEKNLQLSIIGGRPRYGNIELLEKFGVTNYEKIKVDDLTKGIDILEPNVNYGNITLSQSIAALTTAMATPLKTANALFANLRKGKDKEREPPIHLILEEDDGYNNPLSDRTLRLEEQSYVRPEEEQPLLIAPTISEFIRTNFGAEELKPLALDALTMYDPDNKFFDVLEINPNIPRYLDKLKDYLN